MASASAAAPGDGERGGATLWERYQPWRRWVEPGFWIVLLAIQFVVNSLDAIIDVRRGQPDFPAWKPISWELSSHLVVLALVPAIIALERRIPLTFQTWRRNLSWHLLGTVVFCLVHVAAMVGLRQLFYAWMGQAYDFGPWPRELLYEYLKDWRTYATVLLVVGAYRLLLLRLQGEARLLDEPDEGIEPPEPIERPDRFLVRKLGKEFLIAANDIEYLEASGNYVNLHVKGRAYPLRSTMAALEPRLDPSRFARVHRSWMVNLDQIAEIEPLETGDARVRLRDGTQVPCSRKYRATLKR
ncbi:MAG TPA: LytTR family DNA-binding domain-containing protein [Xanthomonadaceae bacterium]